MSQQLVISSFAAKGELQAGHILAKASIKPVQAQYGTICCQTIFFGQTVTTDRVIGATHITEFKEYMTASLVSGMFDAHSSDVTSPNGAES